MKDKEKQIEEMKNNARIYIGGVVEKLRMDGCELYEIDRIVENILNYITVPGDSVVLTESELKQAKGQAVKEFATILKVKTVLTPGGWCVNIEDIDKTLKEVIGEKE